MSALSSTQSTSSVSDEETETHSTVSDEDSLAFSIGSHSFIPNERDIVEQLQVLHRQFASLRGDSDSAIAMQSAVADVTDPTSSGKLIVCCVRRPVKVVHSQAHDGNWEYIESQGGFKSAIDSIGEHRRIRWVCHPECW